MLNIAWTCSINPGCACILDEFVGSTKRLKLQIGRVPLFHGTDNVTHVLTEEEISLFIGFFDPCTTIEAKNEIARLAILMLAIGMPSTNINENWVFHSSLISKCQSKITNAYDLFCALQRSSNLWPVFVLKELLLNFRSASEGLIL